MHFESVSFAVASLQRACVCLVIWIWRFFLRRGEQADSNGVEEVCFFPLGHEEVFQKTLPVTSGPLQTVNRALRWSASAQQPRLATSAGNAIRHVPQAPGPPRRHTGSHTGKTNVHAPVHTHPHPVIKKQP